MIDISNYREYSFILCVGFSDALYFNNKGEKSMVKKYSNGLSMSEIYELNLARLQLLDGLMEQLATKDKVANVKISKFLTKPVDRYTPRRHVIEIEALLDDSPPSVRHEVNRTSESHGHRRPTPMMQ